MVDDETPDDTNTTQDVPLLDPELIALAEQMGWNPVHLEIRLRKLLALSKSNPDAVVGWLQNKLNVAHAIANAVLRLILEDEIDIELGAVEPVPDTPSTPTTETDGNE